MGLYTGLEIETTQGEFYEIVSIHNFEVVGRKLYTPELQLDVINKEDLKRGWN